MIKFQWPIVFVKKNKLIPIAECELTVRCLNALRRGGYLYLNDLTPKKLVGVQGIGKKSIEAIKVVMRTYGLGDTND